MSEEMKVIFERWERFTTEYAIPTPGAPQQGSGVGGTPRGPKQGLTAGGITLKDCPTNTITLGNLGAMMIIAGDDAQAAQEALRALEKSWGSAAVKIGAGASDMTGVISSLGGGALAMPVVKKAIAADLATGGAVFLTAGIAAAVGTMITKALTHHLTKKGAAPSEDLRSLLKLFCIDEETLDLINNDIEKEYYTKSDILEFIKQITKDHPNTELPDLTSHLVKWINTESEIYKADASVSQLAMKKGDAE